MIEGENDRVGARSGSQGRVRLAVRIWNDGRFERRAGLHGNARGVGGDAGFRFFFNADQELIGNFPAEVAVLAALLEILFEEDGAAGIGYESA